MKQVFRGRGLWALVALGLLSVAGVKASAAELPEYNIERCCDLCPLTAYPSSYDTGYLKNFKMLVQGKDGWLFRSEAELVEQFGPNLEGLKHLKRFARHLKETTGTELVMVFQPTKGLSIPIICPRHRRYRSVGTWLVKTTLTR